MADNIVLNAGTGGATLATDELAGPPTRHVQYVKLMDGTPDSASAIPGDGLGLDVDVTRLPPDDVFAGTITALNGAVEADVARGIGALGIQLSGTWVATLEFQGRVNATGWVPIRVWDVANRVLVTQATANGLFAVAAGHLNAVRVVAVAFTSGTVQVDVIATRGGAAVPSEVVPTDLTDRAPRKVGQVFLRNPGDTANMGDAATPLRVDPVGTTTQPVSGTVTANQGGSWAVTADTELPAPAALTDAAANPTVPSVGAFPLVFNGTSWDRARGDVANGLDVDVTRVQGSVTVVQSTPAQLQTTATQGGTWTVLDGGSGKTLKRAVVALTATGDVVAAVAGRRIKVYAWEIQSRNDTMTVQFRDGAAGAFLGVRWNFNTREGAMGSAVQPPTFIFATSAGNALQAVITGTGTVDLAVSYWDDDTT